MKAILVIDDMPKNCSDCWLHRDEYSDYEKAWEDICHNAEHECHVLSTTNYVKRPSWCPLKPIPKKIESGKIEDGTKTNIPIPVEHFAMGWNDCLDEILGETE